MLKSKEVNVESSKTQCTTMQKVMVQGSVKNGKLELDPAMLEEVSGGSVRARDAFVAVNAPFDPLSNAA